jgi:hypothetical protein
MDAAKRLGCHRYAMFQALGQPAFLSCLPPIFKAG